MSESKPKTKPERKLIVNFSEQADPHFASLTVTDVHGRQHLIIVANDDDCLHVRVYDDNSNHLNEPNVHVRLAPPIKGK